MKPYIQKILRTKTPLVYVDCFAGIGKFDDNSKGSPLIALDVICECLEQTKGDEKIVRTYFIEKYHSKKLEENLKLYKSPPWSIVAGNYEEEILTILNNNFKSNIFLYIDPYGIKNLDFAIFKDHLDTRNFNSVELLINFNSYGFIREGFHALGVKVPEWFPIDDLEEYESSKLDKNKTSVELLNKVAGGDYWQSIVQRNNRKEITPKEAEKILTDGYCNELKKIYKYVLNLPIRVKQGQQPKYRLIHVTNHKAGCLLMVDNIWKRWEILRDIQNNNQLTLFEECVENTFVNCEMVKTLVEKHLIKQKKLVSLNEILTSFFMENGVICGTSAVRNILKNLENENKIIVEKTPKLTKINKDSKFFQDDKEKTTKVAWKL